MSVKVPGPGQLSNHQDRDEPMTIRGVKILDTFTKREIIVGVIVFSMGVLSNAVYARIAMEHRISDVERVVEQVVSTVAEDRVQRVGKAEWQMFIEQTREQLKEIRQDLKEMKETKRRS